MPPSGGMSPLASARPRPLLRNAENVHRPDRDRRPRRVVPTHSRARKSSAAIPHAIDGSAVGDARADCGATLRIHPIRRVSTVAAAAPFPRFRLRAVRVRGASRMRSQWAPDRAPDELQIAATPLTRPINAFCAPEPFPEFQAASDDESAHRRGYAEIAADYGGSDFAWLPTSANRRRTLACPASTSRRPGRYARPAASPPTSAWPVLALPECILPAAQADIAEKRPDRPDRRSRRGRISTPSCSSIPTTTLIWPQRKSSMAGWSSCARPYGRPPSSTASA